MTGLLLLAVTAALHLYLGLPPLTAAISSGNITATASMLPSELVGIWVAFSIILFFFIGGVMLHLRRAQIDRIPVFFCGLAAVAVALTMLIYNPGVHISVPLLAVPGFFIVLGAGLLEPAPKDG